MSQRVLNAFTKAVISDLKKTEKSYAQAKNLVDALLSIPGYRDFIKRFPGISADALSPATQERTSNTTNSLMYGFILGQHSEALGILVSRMSTRDAEKCDTGIRRIKELHKELLEKTDGTPIEGGALCENLVATDFQFPNELLSEIAKLIQEHAEKRALGIVRNPANVLHSSLLEPSALNSTQENSEDSRLPYLSKEQIKQMNKISKDMKARDYPTPPNPRR